MVDDEIGKKTDKHEVYLSERNKEAYHALRHTIEGEHLDDDQTGELRVWNVDCLVILHGVGDPRDDTVGRIPGDCRRHEGVHRHRPPHRPTVQLHAEQFGAWTGSEVEEGRVVICHDAVEDHRAKQRPDADEDCDDALVIE